jgi:hypothetical protein
MKRKSSPTPASKSLKTFYLYALLVIAAIGISFVIKAIIIFQQSKFDGRHHFTIAITQNNHVKEVIAFSPQVPALAVLDMKDNAVAYATLAAYYGISTDAQVDVSSDIAIDGDVAATLWQIVRHYPTVKTNATIVDLIRLNILAKNVIPNNKIIRDIELTKKNPENNTIISRALNDPSLSSENVSIQIINATDVTGFGQRLGRVLTNMGANVVEVSTDNTTQSKSEIRYYGEPTYTLEEVKRLLKYPSTPVTREPIANIVIILGEDSINTSQF